MRSQLSSTPQLQSNRPHQLVRLDGLVAALADDASMFASARPSNIAFHAERGKACRVASALREYVHRTHSRCLCRVRALHARIIRMHLPTAVLLISAKGLVARK